MSFFLHLLEVNRRSFAIALTTVTIFVFSIPIITYTYFAKDLTSKESVMNRNDTGITLLDSSNQPFFTFYQAKQKVFVPLSDVPIYTQQAVIVSEDKDFYKHPGFSIKGIIRSFFMNILKRDAAYGGSTITQQLVKNALLTPQKSFLRKYQEIVLAQEIERRYSKQEILEMYLASVYFGEGSFGIEEAALTYFGKHAKELTLAESGLLAGLLPSPSRLSPISGDKKEAFIRQKIILQKMREEGYITSAQEEQAKNEKIPPAPTKKGLNIHATHFAIMVKDELIKKYGEEYIARSGFKVRTTLDLEWQKYAEEIVLNQVEKLAPNNVSNGAAVVIDPKTGAIKVLVGSKDWNNDEFGKYNVPTAIRQPGSSFKPIVYAAALEKHLITTATILHDQPTTFGGNYRPKNYDGKFRGQVTVRRALSNSLNVPSVEVMSKVGVNDALEMAKRLGITTLQDTSQYGLSLVLGAGEVKLLELTEAYAIFANQGVRNEPFVILSIEDKRNQQVYKHNPNPQRVLDASYAFLISSILSDNKTRTEQFGNLLDISRLAAVKTGTSEDYRDSLTLGYTPSIAIGAWVGNNNSTPMDNIAGSLGAAPIWKALMEQFLYNIPVEEFIVPDGIVLFTTCTFTAKADIDATASAHMEYFAKGTEPLKPCIKPTPSIAKPQSSLPPTTMTPTHFPSPTQQLQMTPVPTKASTTITPQVEKMRGKLNKR